LFRKNKNLLQQELAAARQAGVEEQWGWKNKLAASYPSFAAMYLKRKRTKGQRHHPDLTRSFVEEAGESYYTTPHIDQLNGVLYYNTFLNGLEELLRYADRNAMAHGVEVRLPFLNHELVQFIFSLPGNYKIRDGRTKWLLRETMENKIPAPILHRTDKTGFEPPQQQWMQDERLQEYMREAMRGLVKNGVLRASVLDKKIQPLDAHAAENYNWRYLLAGRLL
jgi:asparagine synthase (glutamine-hydrolysing)